MTPEIHIVATIAKNGVIGRTSKLCAHCCGHACTMDGLSTALVPCSRCNGGRIVCNGTPWDEAEYYEDAIHFADLTAGHAVITGRRTMESMGYVFPLTGRTNIVVSSTLPEDKEARYEVRRTFDGALMCWTVRTELPPCVFVVGGAELFADALHVATHLDLTLIGREYEGDVLFPGWPSLGISKNCGGFTDAVHGTQWHCTERRAGDHPDLTFTRWVRR